MNSYRVIWAVLIDADSPEEAVAEARDMQLDENTLATTFNVTECTPDGRTPYSPSVVIDADSLTPMAVH